MGIEIIMRYFLKVITQNSYWTWVWGVGMIFFSVKFF